MKRSSLDVHESEKGLHFRDAGEEFLALHYDGKVLTRSRARNGSLHIHVTSWPKLLPWIFGGVGVAADDFWVGIHPLPKGASRRIKIRSVITLFVVHADEYPLVLAREPLEQRDVDELIRCIPPPLALLNGDQLYYNSRAPHPCPPIT